MTLYVSQHMTKHFMHMIGLFDIVVVVYFWLLKMDIKCLSDLMLLEFYVKQKGNGNKIFQSISNMHMNINLKYFLNKL